MTAAPGPLAGIRVVELGSIGPVPFAGMMLAELGADVVRVDRPGESNPLALAGGLRRSRPSIAVYASRLGSRTLPACSRSPGCRSSAPYPPAARRLVSQVRRRTARSAAAKAPVM